MFIFTPSSCCVLDNANKKKTLMPKDFPAKLLICFSLSSFILRAFNV